MIMLPKSLLLLLVVHLAVLVSALRRQGGIERYDAQSLQSEDRNAVFTSAVLDETTGALVLLLLPVVFLVVVLNV